MRKILAWAFALALPLGASAQSTVLQGGPTAAGHAPAYISGGSQPIVMDSGPASGGAIGYGLGEINITSRGSGAGPYASNGTGPFGTHGCFQDNPTSTANYHFLCIDPNAQGGGLFAYGAAGTASPLPFHFNLNGTTYEFPVSVGGVTGPVSSTIGDIAIFNNASGNLLADSGNSLSKTGPNWASPGTTIYDALRMSVNNFPITAQFGNNTVSIVEGIVGAIDVPSSAIGGNATLGIAGYGRTASTTTGAVGVFGGGSANADGVSSWGGNFLVSNAPLLTLTTPGTGYNSTVGYGLEIDVNLTTASGNVAPTSAMRGLYIVGGSNTVPANGLSATFDAIGIDSPGVTQSPILKWNNALTTADGSAVNAVSIGTTAKGNSVGSQNLVFRSRDSGGTVHTVNLAADTSGDLSILSQPNTVVEVNGLLSVLANSSAVNGLQIVGGSTTNPVVLTPFGSDTNVSIELLTKGTGSYEFAFNAASPVTGLTLSKGGTGANFFEFQTASSGTDATISTSSGNLGLSASTGLIQFPAAGSWTTNGSVAATFTASSAPTGAHTTIQEWLTIVDNGGNTRYIPVF